MQCFLRQRLMLMSAKLVVESSLLLLLVAYWNSSSDDFWLKMTKSLMKQYEILAAVSETVHACNIRSFLCCLNIDDTAVLTRSLVNLTELEFLIAFLILLHSRCFDQRRNFLLQSLSALENILLVNATLDALNWRRSDRNHCSFVVSSNMTWI